MGLANWDYWDWPHWDWHYWDWPHGDAEIKWNNTPHMREMLAFEREAWATHLRIHVVVSHNNVGYVTHILPILFPFPSLVPHNKVPLTCRSAPFEILWSLLRVFT